MARVCGIPAYRFAIIEHPISSATREQLAGKAREALAQAAGVLLPW